MDFHFIGTLEEWSVTVQHGSGGMDQQHILDGINAIKELLIMQSAELTKLNEITNTLATTVEEVVAADAAEDAEFLRQIQELKDLLAAANVDKAAVQALLDEMTAGVGDVNPKLEAVIAALKATGSTASNPLPTPVV